MESKKKLIESPEKQEEIKETPQKMIDIIEKKQKTMEEIESERINSLRFRINKIGRYELEQQNGHFKEVTEEQFNIIAGSQVKRMTEILGTKIKLTGEQQEKLINLSAKKIKKAIEQAKIKMREDAETISVRLYMETARIVIDTLLNLTHLKKMISSFEFPIYKEATEKLVEVIMKKNLEDVVEREEMEGSSPFSMLFHNIGSPTQIKISNLDLSDVKEVDVHKKSTFKTIGLVHLDNIITDTEKYKEFLNKSLYVLGNPFDDLKIDKQRKRQLKKRAPRMTIEEIKKEDEEEKRLIEKYKYRKLYSIRKSGHKRFMHVSLAEQEFIEDQQTKRMYEKIKELEKDNKETNEELSETLTEKLNKLIETDEKRFKDVDPYIINLWISHIIDDWLNKIRSDTHLKIYLLAEAYRPYAFKTCIDSIITGLKKMEMPFTYDKLRDEIMDDKFRLVDELGEKLAYVTGNPIDDLKQMEKKK